MITGFNTDVNFQGVTYHVQTEDKGLATPLILSLVYHGGTILASKRSPYDDLISNGFDEKILAERLQKQHKTICAAIRAGRLEELKEMSARDAAAKRKAAASVKKELVKEPAGVQTPSNPEKKNNVAAAPVQSAGQVPVAAVEAKTVLPPPPEPPRKESNGAPENIRLYSENESPIPKPRYDFELKMPPPPAGRPTQPNGFTTTAGEELIIEAVEIIEDEMILPAEAVEIVPETVENRPPADNKLKLKILGDDNFRSGEKKTMTILVHRGSEQNGLSGAQVMVKILGAAFRPLIFHGKTDNRGIAKVHLQMPLFKQGRAAILIKAMSGGEEIELRRTIKHR